MIKYSAKHILNFTTIPSLLQELPEKNCAFIWNETHRNAFSRLTEDLLSQNTKKPMYVTVDVTPVGITAILFCRSNGHDDK